MDNYSKVKTYEFSDLQLKELDEIILKHNCRTKLIPMLEEVQQLLGFIPVEVQEHISQKTGIPEVDIYGVVSFYSFFTMQPRARHRIQVCMGTACYVKGGKKIADYIENKFDIKLGDCTEDGRFTYEQARCFGTCGLAPVMVVDGKVYGKVKVEDIEEILSHYE